MVVQSRTLLDTAAEVLVANPAAPLGAVAQAAGIGRTTLHKHYPTRHDLLVAVAHHCLDRCGAALDGADSLHQLISALVPVGPQLAFLFRHPSLDADAELAERIKALDAPVTAIVEAAQRSHQLRTDRPSWWIVSTIYALVYVAWEGVTGGYLAPRDAPDLVLDTLLNGVAP